MVEISHHPSNKIQEAHTEGRHRREETLKKKVRSSKWKAKVANGRKVVAMSEAGGKGRCRGRRPHREGCPGRRLWLPSGASISHDPFPDFERLGACSMEERKRPIKE